MKENIYRNVNRKEIENKGRDKIIKGECQIWKN